jgi:hypothetical protein
LNLVDRKCNPGKPNYPAFPGNWHGNIHQPLSEGLAKSDTFPNARRKSLLYLGSIQVVVHAGQILMRIAHHDAIRVDQVMRLLMMVDHFLAT